MIGQGLSDVPLQNCMRQLILNSGADGRNH